MSQNETYSPADIAVIIQSYAQSLHTVYIYLMMSTVFGTLLLPFLGVLVKFSSAGQWRSPMFLCVFASTLLALTQMIDQIVLELRILYDPLGAAAIFSKTVVNVTIFLNTLPNFCADLALMCRMLAVFPYASTRRSAFAAIFAPLAAFKVGRIVCMLVFMAYYDRAPTNVSVALSATERMWMIVNQALSLVDNAYATAFFLWQLRGIIQPHPELGRVTTGGSDSIGSRLRRLFWLSVTNFVLPAPLYLLELILAITDAGLAYALLTYINSFVSVVSVAFATVWCSSMTLRDTVKQSSVSFEMDSPVMSTQICFRNAGEAQASLNDSDSTPRSPKPDYPAVRVHCTQSIARHSSSIV